MQKALLFVKQFGLFAQKPAGTKPEKNDMFSLRLQRLRQTQTAQSGRQAVFRNSPSHPAA